MYIVFFFSSRRRHTRFKCDWSSDVCSSDLGAEGMQLEAAAKFYNSRLVNPRKSKMTVAFVGHAQVRGRDALQVEVTTATGVKRQVFFDPQTHVIVKEAATVGGVEEEILYDDYRTVDGVKLPHNIRLHRGNEKYDISVTRE